MIMVINIIMMIIISLLMIMMIIVIIMSKALARGELQCMGATTLDEYRKYIEKEPGGSTSEVQREVPEVHREVHRKYPKYIEKSNVPLP